MDMEGGGGLAREAVTLATYLTASVLFILGLKGLTKAETARRGMQYAAIGMLLAIVGTLIKQEIVSYTWIIAGLVIGTVIGWPLGTQVPMTAMPQRIAISHMFGALAATLVGVAEYYTHIQSGIPIPRPIMAALGFEVLFGSLTVTGSFMAFGKLQEILPGRPITYKGQNAVNLVVFVSTLLMFGYLIVRPERAAGVLRHGGHRLLSSASAWCCRSVAATCRSSSRCSTRTRASRHRRPGSPSTTACSSSRVRSTARRGSSCRSS